MLEWSQIRRHKFSGERPAEWLASVQGISTEGLNLLGINERTGKLHWDGDEIVTKNLLRFQTYERFLATCAALIALAGLILNIGKSAGWWH